jgi:hypothetical protein
MLKIAPVSVIYKSVIYKASLIRKLNDTENDSKVDEGDRVNRSKALLKSRGFFVRRVNADRTANLATS